MAEKSWSHQISDEAKAKGLNEPGRLGDRMNFVRLRTLELQVAETQEALRANRKK